ncbi:hypothetical protein [Stenotrophomonas maltophilia]|uniref:hypothetical protein n=1 Tax=Stenotrophomonas maltophilia TaxID=40324 RepID=UPI0009BF3E24|nr:hypothetical protein [Stenotrophomonas maltophilia]
MRLMTFICPLCGASGQRFPLRFAGRRQAKMSCRRCRVELRSDPRLGTYTLYLLYTQVVILVAALPLIGASVAAEWVRLGTICLVVLELCWFPGVIRHARSPIVRACRDADYSYARRPGASIAHAAANPEQRSDTPSASP